MKLPWFHVEQIPAVGGTLELEPGESHHAGRSNRLRTGDRAVVSDGRGLTAEVVLEQFERRHATARTTRLTRVEPRYPSLHLASALPKGDRLATLLSMATQLGMTSFTPLACERSVVKPPDSPPERWYRIVREAGKQSRQAWLPSLEAPATPAELAEEIDATQVVLRMDPRGATADEWLRLTKLDAPESLHILVGPEGGFTPGEMRSLDEKGATATALATGVLRIETAAVAALARLSALREDTG